MKTTSPAPEAVWRELLERDPDALVSQSPEWVSALCATGAYRDASRLYETDSGNRLVLPMVRRAWPLGFQGSMPHACGMGGLLADEPPSAADVGAVAAQLDSEPALRTSIRPNPLHGERWSSVSGRGVVSISRRAHVLDLGGGVDAAWSGLKKSARGGVRKAQRSGLEIECSTDGRLVPVFYGLLERSTERWAAAQHEPLALARWRLHRRDPIGKFERLASAFGERMRIWVAWKDGAPAAAMVVLVGSNATDTRGAMDKELAAPTNANDLLQWMAIEDACTAGCRSYHMGESGQSVSLSRYKEKFGARPVDYPELRIERPGLSRAEDVPRRLAKRLLRFKDA